MTSPSTTLRERTRRAVQSELVGAAQRLFVEQGYETTTIDAIASAAGMSKRSFFRYFASKEELLLGKYDLMAEQMISVLEGRPEREAIWASLRRMFDEVVAYTADASNTATMDEMERVISATPTLHAAYLGRLDEIQERIADVVRARDASRWAESDPAPRAIVGAAFACVGAARQAALRTGRRFADEVDSAMSVIRIDHDG